MTRGTYGGFWNPVLQSGVLVTVIALAVVVGWLTRQSALVHIHSELAPMQFNTAFGHLLGGIALILLWRGNAGAVMVCAGLVTLLGGVTLLQYVTGTNTGLDTLWVEPFTQVRTLYPGRMAPNTAFAFVLVGFALGAAARELERGRSSRLSATLGWLVGLMALASMITYASATHTYFFVWGKSPIGMALHTAFCFLLISVGLIFWSMRTPQHLNLQEMRGATRAILLYSLGMTALTLTICAVLVLAPLWGLIHESARQYVVFGALAALMIVLVGMSGLNRLLRPLTESIIRQNAALEAGISETQAAMQRLEQESQARIDAEREGRLNEARYRVLAEATQTAIWFTDSQGRISRPMPSWARFTGQTWEEYQGMGGFSAVHPEDMPQLQREWAEAVNLGSFSSEYRLHNVDGTYHYVQSRGIALRDEQGKIQEWIGSVYDIQPIKDAEEKLRMLNAELEERVRRRTEQLAHSNRELEQFAYAASHDLKTPLRSITSFASLLRRRYDAQLPETAREFIDLIRESAVQGQSLVNDMLEISRIPLDQPPPSLMVSLEDGLDKALHDLRETTGLTAKIHRQPLPRVRGDAAQLSCALKCLLLNAMRYQPRGQPQHQPQVWIDALREKTAWTIRVRDNGIGIAAEDHARIFRMFQRLHTQEQYPGNGIGLTLSDKILKRHGGRLWLDSSLGEGATFHCVLPDPPTLPTEPLYESS